MAPDVGTHGSLTVSTYWGVAASLTAGLVNAIGYSLQKRALARTEGDRYCRDALWWKGFALLLVAEACGGVAFGLLAGSVVIAFGGVALIFNALLSIGCQGERVTPCLVWGTASIVLGAVVLGAVTPPTKQVETAAELEADLLSSRSAAYHAVVAAVCLSLRAKRDAIAAASALISLIGLATEAAAVSSVTAVWFRAFVALLFRATSSADHWVLYASALIAGATGVWAAGWLEPRGLRRFPQSRWIPMHFVSCLVWFGASGAAVYGESILLPEAEALFVLALLLNLLGVILIER